MDEKQKLEDKIESTNIDKFFFNNQENLAKS